MEEKQRIPPRTDIGTLDTELTKISQIMARLLDKDIFPFILFLCGYFDSGYLGYEAAEGIDWVWEHRTNDLALFEI